jgi:hypothetical protein
MRTTGDDLLSGPYFMFNTHLQTRFQAASRSLHCLLIPAIGIVFFFLNPARAQETPKPSPSLVAFSSSTPTLTPMPTPALGLGTATATPTIVASVTSTPTPTLTPIHIVVDHQPFWNSGLGISLLIVIATILVVIGLSVWKGGPNGLVDKLLNLFNDFTNILAYMVVVLAFGGILLLSCHVLGAADQKNRLDVAKYVFAAVLPLLGTWVGAVLAHYFQKENLAAATQSISDLASKVAATDKLQSVPVTSVMKRGADIITLPEKFQGETDDIKIPLKDLVDYLKGKNCDRLIVFQGNAKSGPGRCVVHLSAIEKFISEQALASDPAKPPPPPTLNDLLKEKTDKSAPAPAPTDPLKAIFQSSFGLVSQKDSLARAKAVMDNLSKALGAAGNCYDVLVTENGHDNEPVIGWITNDIINENAKV